MATVAIPVVERPAIKPTRSMTHPLRDPKATNGSRRRVKQGEPFDAEDLSRRLQAHLVEQKIRSEQRRAARAARVAREAATLQAQQQAAAAENVYHHVPAVAAQAFERTTTPADRMHKVAQPIVQALLQRISLDDTSRPYPHHPTTHPHPHSHPQPLTLLQKTVQKDQVALQTQHLHNRNQFQWTPSMESAALSDSARNIYAPPQRTFNGEFSHLIGSSKKSRDVNSANRPLSTGDLFPDEDATESNSSPDIGLGSLAMREKERKARERKKAALLQHEIVNEHRNDWAQRDDEVDAKRKSGGGERGSPFLRKMESSWMLIGKKSGVGGSGNGGKRDEGVAGLGGSPELGGVGERERRESVGKVKGSFLARFKRHPS